MKAALLLALSLALACSSTSPSASADGGVDSGGGGGGDGEENDASTSDLEIPALGVYKVHRDGSGLTLIANTGVTQFTHVRGFPGTDWLTATRYNKDIDGNGLSMEGEGGGQPNYSGTEIVLFRESDPSKVFAVKGTGLDCDGVFTVCANASWTSDGKLILLNSHDGSDGHDWLKRVTFGTLPAAESVETIPFPEALFFPVDPHQHGDSSSGTIVFSGAFNQGTVESPKWMRPLWKMPASGTTLIGEGNAEFVGCPTCESESGMCCSEESLENVKGTNDARIRHDGGAVLWMQASREREASVLGVPINPYRQFIKPIEGGFQEALDTTAASESTSHAYAEWSPDDESAVYWEIRIDGDSLDDLLIREDIYSMNPDGTERTRIPLPDDLCSAHPSFLDDDTVVFTGWRCGGENCTCAQSTLSAD